MPRQATFALERVAHRPSRADFPIPASSHTTSPAALADAVNQVVERSEFALAPNQGKHCHRAAMMCCSERPLQGRTPRPHRASVLRGKRTTTFDESAIMPRAVAASNERLPKRFPAFQAVQTLLLHQAASRSLLSPYKGLAITDEASPFALRSTRKFF